ncbi:hypothetical protein DFH09DRAFT_1271912 [Mycena vulgaris]|nr:hypothetical protein DFH09DRAFT_1271912 [Mycena vulgaris]
MASPSPRIPVAIRAITTPLRSSAAPAIPPAAQLYAPLAKAVLHRRLTRRILPYTALLCLVLATFQLASISRLSAGRVVGTAVALWTGGVLPVLLLRKAHLTVTRTHAPSPLLLLQKSMAPPLRARTLRALQTHALSALCVLAVHVALDPAVPVFIKSRKHPWAPHPVLVLLTLSQCALAGLCVLRAVLRDVWVFPFRRPTLAPAPGALLAPLLLPLATLPIAIALCFVALPLARRLPLLRPFLPPSPRPSALLALPRAWALGAQTAAAWEVAAAVWAWAVGEPLRTTPSLRALVSGISVAGTPAPPPSAFSSSSAFSSAAPSPLTSASPAGSFLSPRAPASTPTKPAPTLAPTIYTHLAYAELLALAAKEDDAGVKGRAEAFEGDVWARFVREALVLLGGEYRVLVGRGSSSPAAPPSAVAGPVGANAGVSGASASAISGLKTPRRTPLLTQNVFATRTPPSAGARVGAALASGGAVEGVVEGVLPAVPAVRVPGWVDPARWAGVGAGWAQGLMPAWVAGAGWYVERAKEAGLPRAWTRERAGRGVGAWVPRREVCVEAVGVLTHLICASLAEDRLGAVQRDIPRVLEALLAFLGAVEGAQGALRAVGTDAKQGKEGRGDTEKEEEERDLAEARAVLGDVGDALKDGVARIVRTFGDKLRAFRFPPRTAARLQEFVDYLRARARLSHIAYWAPRRARVEAPVAGALVWA